MFIKLYIQNAVVKIKDITKLLRTLQNNLVLWVLKQR